MNSKMPDPTDENDTLSPSKLDSGGARHAFGRAARRLDGNGGVVEEVARRMQERLDYVRLEPGNILDLGCGMAPAGMLAQRYPAARVTGIDSSIGPLVVAGARKTFLSHLKEALGWGSARGQIGLVCGDMCNLPFADASVDLVWSNLALAWAADLGKAFIECHRVLKDGGLLMFSSYGPDTLCELRAAFRCADDYPHVHEFVDMHDVGDLLVAGGFSDPVMDMDKIVCTYADVLSLVRDLRRGGQTNVMERRRRGLTGRNAWNAMTSAYPVRASDARIGATFEIVYGHAWKIGRNPRGTKSSDGISNIQWFPDRGIKA
jgi:malonyl-CoA O-methyltransferase